ncbi:MAG: hypothetical protein NTY07_07335 [Bacteroidia bacterium]|nr:hypothetical protein [Bacteroidia bacterium]
MNQNREGGALKEDKRRKSVSIKGMWKSLRLMHDKADAEMADSTKLRMNRSHVGMLLFTKKIVAVFSKVRSFKAWQCNGNAGDLTGSFVLSAWQSFSLLKTEQSE